MSNFIQNSLPVLTRLMQVIFVFALGLATVVIAAMILNAWNGITSAHTLMASAGALLLAVILAIEALRRIVRYIFLGDAFFKGKPGMAVLIFLAIPVLMLLAAAVLTPFALHAQAKEQEEERAALKTRY
ncbi:MAG TPA: hypothetical protein VGP13_03700, partial [Candidatus Paceibacterota bacterium]|nr:hypothetical protein [Candidatus Paceibacterota bacterium]